MAPDLARPTDLVERFAESLARRLGDNLVSVSLFGSRARGDHHHRSDYDLMIVLAEASGEARSVVHQLATEFELELEHSIDLSTKLIDRASFERSLGSWMPFWKDFARDQRVLWKRTSSASA